MKIKALWLWQAVSHIKKMHSETVFSSLEFSGIDCANFICDMAAQNQFIEVDEKGLMIGEINTAFFSRDLAANDVLVYVRPEYRGSGIAESAISNFINWAESHGAKLITIGQSTGRNSDEFVALVKKLELKPLGAVYGRT